MGMKYSDIVDYDKLDPFKEAAISQLRKTLKYTERHGIRILEESLGGTAAVLDMGDLGDFYLAFNVEGLGTKNLIAEELATKGGIGEPLYGKRRTMWGIGQDEMAMTLNDLSACGASPIVFEPIIASGDSGYFDDKERYLGLIDGFEIGARKSGVAIPGGETPTLKGIVYENTLDIAGGSVGIVRPKSRLALGDRIESGLMIFGISSSGLHSNGYSLARKIAEKLPDRYLTKLPSGRTLGEALLEPTVIYSPLIEDLQEEGVDIRFMQPITGHGLAKIMRYNERPFTYLIESLPEKPEEVAFLENAGEVTEEESLRTWNNGIGLVIFAPQSDDLKIEKSCYLHGRELQRLGYVIRGPREVVIDNKDITFRPKP